MTTTGTSKRAVNHIMVVEDNEDHLALTLEALEDAGVANPICTAGSLGAARRQLERCAEEAGGRLPCVILLDVRLPDGSGMELLREIRRHPVLSAVPVVMLTSSDNAPDIETAYQLGVNSYLVKPISFEEFHRKVGEAGLYWALLNEPFSPLSEHYPSDRRGHRAHV